MSGYPTLPTTNNLFEGAVHDNNQVINQSIALDPSSYLPAGVLAAPRLIDRGHGVLVPPGPHPYDPSAAPIRQLQISFSLPSSHIGPTGSRSAHLVAFNSATLEPMIYGDVVVLHDDHLVVFLANRYPHIRRIILRFQFHFSKQLECRQQEATLSGLPYDRQREAMECVFKIAGPISRALDTVTPLLAGCEVVLRAELDRSAGAPPEPDLKFEKHSRDAVEIFLRERAKVIGLAVRVVERGAWTCGSALAPAEYVPERIA